LIDLGNIYLSWEGHQGQANSCWEQALNINETDPDIYHRISLNFLNRRMVDKAIEYLKRGDRLIGKGVLTLDLANAHTLRMDYGNATNYYLQYLIQDPNRFNYVERAICAFPTDDQVTTPVISALKANASAVSQRLLTGYLFSLAKYDEVFKYLDQTKLTPDESLTYASQLLTEARPDLALKLYQSLQKGSIPDKFLPSALLGEADCHFRSGEFRLAIDLYQKIPVQFPRTPSAETALFRSGEIYWENLNLLDSSRYCFEKLCAEYPYGSYYFQAQLKLGLCSLISGDLDQALNFYRRVSTISDKRSLELKSEAMLATGRCWLWKGEPDSALAVFDQLARLYPNTDAANDALNDAMLLNKSGDKSLLYLFSSAWLASIRKDYTLSLKGYKRIMEAAPGTALASRSALSSTEDLLTSVNDFANALSLLQDYLDRNPDCENKDALNFKMAEIFQFYAHDAQKSSHHYEQVLLETPDSPLVPIARKRLQELGTGI
jgi:tetratricopeptide (TPR) repeat protein